MIPQQIQRLFEFVDFLDNNKAEYIKTYIPLCNEYEILDRQKKELNPNGNYRDRQQYDNIQTQIEAKFSPIKENVYTPITNKLRELEIWSDDDTYASIWNNNISAISDFKKNFSEKDIQQIMMYKQKYISFRTETNTHFYCLSLVFQEIDEVLKELFDFFKDTNENEFDSFETKTIEVSSIAEDMKGISDNIGRNVGFSIPIENVIDFSKESQMQTQPNRKTEIIMGDKIEVGDISDNSGQISINNRGQSNQKVTKTTEPKNSKWIIAGVIVAVVGVIVAILVRIF